MFQSSFRSHRRYALCLLSITALLFSATFWAGFPASLSSDAHAGPPPGKGKGGGGGGDDDGGSGGPSVGYELLPLGSVLSDLNDDGVIVGSRTLPDRNNVRFPYVLFPEDSDGDGSPDTWFVDNDGDGLNDLPIELPTPFARGKAVSVNNYGEIVGQALSNQQGWGAALWKDGVYVQLGTLVAEPGTSAPNFVSSADGINDFGVVVGELRDTLDDGTLDRRVFVINPLPDASGEPDIWFQDNDGDGGNDLMVDLMVQGAFPEINNLGWVMFTDVSSWDTSAALIVPEDTDGDGAPDTWVRDDDGDGINDLLAVLPPLNDGEAASPFELNSNGDIVGYSGGQAVVWHVDLDPISVSTTPLPDPKVKGKVSSSLASAITEDGQMVVGYATAKEGHPTCVWQNGKAALLKDLVTNPEVVDVEGLTGAPESINSFGEFVINIGPETYIALPRVAP